MKYSKGKVFTRSNINITATTIIITRITIAKINSVTHENRKTVITINIMILRTKLIICENVVKH